MRDLRRHVATQGAYVPHPGWRPPWWWSVAQAARYWQCHPEEVMAYPSVWVDIAAACIEIENHAAEVAAQRRN